MLVKLTSSTSGEMIMFAEHARRLFEIIGKECSARGVFTKEQLPDALAKLHLAVEEDKQNAKRIAEEKRVEQEKKKDDDETEAKQEEAISLGQRAHPLIHMMELSLKEEGFILWEAAKDF